MMQAADIVRIVGIGRNEYISIMNRCKAKKLLWRVNKAIVREHLPIEPVDIDMRPFWVVNVVNLGPHSANTSMRSVVSTFYLGISGCL